MKKNTSYKPFWCIFLVVAILCIGLISAEELVSFDNVKSYDSVTKTVTIVNTLGLGRDISTIQLLTPINNKVGLGYQNVAEFEIDLFDDTYTDAFEKMEFYDLNKDEEKFERDFDYKYLTTELVNVNDYKEICSLNKINGTEECSSVIVGTHKEEKEVWKDFDTKTLLKGKVTIGIFTDVQVGDYVEWIPTLFGKEINEWATWTADLNVGLRAYYSFEQASGTNALNNITSATNGTLSATSPAWATGKLGNGIDFTNGDGYYLDLTGITSVGNSHTICFWIKNRGVTSADNFVLSIETGKIDLQLDSSNQDLKMTGPATVTYDVLPNSWTDVCLVLDSTAGNVRMYYDGVQNGANESYTNKAIGGAVVFGNRFSMGPGYYSNYILDEIGIWNRSLTDAEISYRYNDGDGCAYGDDTCGVVPDNSPEVNLNTPIDTANFSTNEITFGGVASDDSNLINVSLIIDDVYNETNTSGINNSNYTFTKIFADGDYTWNYEACDNDSLCTNGTARTFTIDTSSPEVIILAPPETVDSHVLNTNLTFNWSANDTHIDTCIYNYEGVNYTVTCSDNTTSINITNTENRTIIFYVNDTLGNMNVTTRTWSYNFIETGSLFTTNVFETMNYSFAINVTSYQTLTSFSAFLSYNGTTYSADSTCTSGNCVITAMIDIPLLNPGQTTENKTFFWRLSIFNGTGTSNINTSTQTQNVTAVNFVECNTAPLYANISSVNFTTHKEVDRSALVTNFNSYFQYYLGTGSVIKLGNSSQTGASIYQYCIDQNETFYTSSSIDLSAASYDSRHYDLIKQRYTNITTIQPLYLLNSTLSSIIIIEVKDQGLVPIEGIVVNISRFYPGEGKYYPIENQITDEFGQIIARLIENDVKYKFSFYNQAGNLLKTSDSISIACRSAYCVIPFVIEDDTDDFERFENLTTYTSTLSFDNTTNVFSFSWDDQRGETATTRLEVTRMQLNASTLVCNTSSTSILSTLSCSVGSQRASYKAQVFRIADGKSVRVALLNLKVGDLAQTFGVEGLLWVFILLFTCVGIGAFNPTVGGVLYGVGFVIMGVVGIISMPIPVFFANTLLVVLFVWGVNK